MVGVRSLPRQHDIGLELGRALMPPRGLLQQDVKLHWRWHFTYEFLKPGMKKTVTSKTWGGKDGFSEYSALVLVTKNAWKLFETDEGGFKCPFDLDEVWE